MRQLLVINGDGDSVAVERCLVREQPEVKNRCGQLPGRGADERTPQTEIRALRG